MKFPIYLDYNATTPVDPRVLDAMLPFLRENFGNPGSKTHAFGWKAEEAVGEARGHVAELLGARSGEIVFTSGATESDNLAILGCARRHRRKGRHIVTSLAEHKAVLDPLAHLEKEHDFTITRLRPDRDGRVSATAVQDAIRDDTILVSLMWANNEIGTLNPIAEVGAVTRSRGVLFHSDAAQAVGKIPIDLRQSPVDLVSLSGHKMYGVKGAGALYIRQRDPKADLEPIMFGGGQESGLRPGTLSVPLIVSLGEACRVCVDGLAEEGARLRTLAGRLRQGIEARVSGVSLNGHPTERLPGNLHLAFAGVDAHRLLLSLPDIALSTGAACTSAKPEPSHVLKAIGLPRDRSFSSVRFGVGRFTREDEIEFVIERIGREVDRLRLGSPGARTASR